MEKSDKLLKNNEDDMKMRKHMLLIARNAHLAFISYLETRGYSNEEIELIDDNWWESV